MTGGSIKDMCLLLVTDYKGSWPYIPELRKELLSRGINVDLLDIGNLVLIDSENREHRIGNPFFGRVSHARGLGLIVRIITMKGFFRKSMKRYDVMNIHFNDPIYSLVGGGYLRTIATRLAVSIWGSDYYRVGNRIRKLQSRVYDNAEAITFINPQTADDFVDHYNKYGEKCRILRFGLGSIEAIKEIRLKESIRESRKAIGLPEDAFVITCGYNASPAQEHRKIIRMLNRMSRHLPEKTVVALPMTYPENREYRKSIEALLRGGCLIYRMFDSFMNPADVARLRIATDIVLNIQTTDQLSASVQEHLYAGNVVLTGKWLPYDIFDSLGVFFIRVTDLEEMETRLLEVIGRYGEFRDKCKKNRDILYGFSGWEGNIMEWIRFYEDLTAGSGITNRKRKIP